MLLQRQNKLNYMKSFNSQQLSYNFGFIEGAKAIGGKLGKVGGGALNALNAAYIPIMAASMIIPSADTRAQIELAKMEEKKQKRAGVTTVATLPTNQQLPPTLPPNSMR